MRIWLCVIVFFACAVLPVIADDTSVEIASDLNGKLYLPEGTVTPTRIVLMLHGWNSHLDEVGNLYKDLASQLGVKGIASLRFNFSGEGERAGYVVTSTFDSRIAETIKAYQYLRAQYPDAIVGVQGFSLGSLTAMAVAAEHPGWFQTMVLWSAADSTMNIERDIVYSEAIQQAMRNGSAVYSTWTDITLTRKHLASFVGVDASLKLFEYPGPFLSIRGDQDYVPSNERKWFSLLPTQDKEFILVGGADHIFSVLDVPRPAYGERVIEETIDWFDRTLDL
jgi:pimeloyl-ACP methyl ester carboxylesterase